MSIKAVEPDVGARPMENGSPLPPLESSLATAGTTTNNAGFSENPTHKTDTEAAPSTEPDYSDARMLGDYESRYPAAAWIQISVESLYLIGVTVLTMGCVLALALRPDLMWEFVGFAKVTLPRALQRQVQIWGVVFLSGMAGATAFSTKWLYHSVARNKWNRDRLIWRLAVPFQGGALAVFTGTMILSGLIPLLNKALFLRIVSSAGYGFLVGLFADNFLAALEKFAGRVLGTLGRSE